MSKNLSELAGRKGLQENLFEELGVAAKRSGTVSKAKMEELADKFLIGKGNVYGTTSFYDFLKEENKGKQVYVCNGSSCMTAGTQDDVRTKLSGVFKDTLLGIHLSSVKFGNNRNSLNVLDISSKTFDILIIPLLFLY